MAASLDSVIVGAYAENGSGSGVNPPSDDDLDGSGAAFVFIGSGPLWVQQAYLKAPNPGSADLFGISVGIYGDKAVVGSKWEDGSGNGVDPPFDETSQDSGSAYLFHRNGGSWSLGSYLKASNTGSDDEFGHAVAIAENLVVVGARYEDGNGSGVDPSNNNALTNVGAAYIFQFGDVDSGDSELRIKQVYRVGDNVTIVFVGEAGVADWLVKGSGDLNAFGDDVTAQSSITEVSAGEYRAVVDVSGLPQDRYFLRIER